jgi:hypothetical protein
MPTVRLTLTLLSCVHSYCSVERAALISIAMVKVKVTVKDNLFRYPKYVLSRPCLSDGSARTKFITGQNEREETTQDAIVTKSAAFASYEINYLKMLAV